MNIELQCCGMAMLIILLLIISKEKSLDLSSRKLFFRTLCACIACLGMDILSIVGIISADNGSFPPDAARLICKLYLVFLIFQGYMGFLYAAGEFFADNAHKLLRRSYMLIFLAGCIAIAFLPIYYLHEDRIVYSYGPSTAVTYVLAFILIISTIVMAFVGSEGTSRRRRWCILVWQGSWLVAAIAQFLKPDFLVVGFAASFGMLLIYADLENPHEGIDRMTGQFTANALSTYIGDLYRNDRTFSSIWIRVEYRSRNVDMEMEKAVMLHISNFLNQDQKAFVFRQAEDEFIVIYPNDKLLWKYYETASAQLDGIVNFPVKIWYTLIPDSSLLYSADEYMQFHHYLDTKGQQQETRIVDQHAVEEMREYLQVRDMIDWALTNHRVEVYYQPIYHVQTKRFTAAEALVRIRDDKDRLIMPGTFIPVAEENGLIIPLGTEIFRQVCAFLATGMPQECGLEYIEVNLSMAQFDDDNPADFIRKAMEDFEIRPDWINLEITETANATTRQAVLRNMDQLIKQGMRFALDDFGTGRSNLDYFVTMPVDIIKFDYKFTQWYFKSRKAKYVIESLIQLMNRMELPIVAEGVETKEQLETMCGLGVAYIQGFYFSKPLPREEFIGFLKEREFLSDTVQSALKGVE